MPLQLLASLRGKTLLIVLTTILGLVAGLYGLSRIALLREFSNLGDDFARQNLQQASAGVSNELATLQHSADNYADLNETYANVASRSRGALAAEFSNASFFERTRLNFVVVLDSSGNRLLQQGFDLTGMQPEAVPAGLDGELASGSPLVQSGSGQSNDVTGIVSLSGGLAMITSSPIVAGNNDLPVGRLVVGRNVDSGEINRLADITRLPIEIQPFKLNSSDPDFREAARALSSGQPDAIVPYSADDLVAYQPLFDVRGKPAAIMRIDLPRKIYQQGQTSIVQFLLLLLATGFVFGAVMLYLLERFVLSRVAALSKDVVKIGASGDMAARLDLSGNDEISFLGSSINGMLGDLERVENERQRERARLTVMLENMPAVLWTTNAQLAITSAMGAGLDAIALPSREAPGLSLFDFFRTRDPEFPAVAAHRKALEGQAVSFETPWQTRQFEGHVRPLKDSDGTLRGVIGVALDITDRERLMDQLRQSQKMQAVGELAGGVAHDFNNLLMVVKGHAQLLYDRLADTPSLRGSVEQVEKAADRAAALTRQLLAFSRKQVLQPRVLDLNEVVAGMIKMFSRVIGENIEMTFVPGANLGRVKADPGQIEQVLLNLVVNARDAMPTGGRLTIETTNSELDSSYGSSRFTVQPGKYVMLTVTDTGCGMDAETQARIFEPFFTTKGPGKGTGLGLATVYGVVKQSGGYIWVYSEVNRGTTFKIYLPEVRDQIEKVQEAAKRTPQRGSETVLFVEDERSVRELVGGYLRSVGYEVLEAEDGEQALQSAAAHKGPIHILITDVVMPHMSGPELAAKLAGGRPEMKVLFVSGYTDDTVFRHGVLEGGVAYLQKPFSLRNVSRKIRDVLNGRVLVEVAPGVREQN